MDVTGLLGPVPERLVPLGQMIRGSSGAGIATLAQTPLARTESGAAHIGQVREHRTAARWPATDIGVCNGSQGRLCRQRHHQAGVRQDGASGDLGGLGVRPCR